MVNIIYLLVIIPYHSPLCLRYSGDPLLSFAGSQLTGPGERRQKSPSLSAKRSSWKRRPRGIPVSVRLLAFLQRLAQQLHGMKDLDFLRRIEVRPDRQVASGAAGAENLRSRRVDIGDRAFRDGL